MADEFQKAPNDRLDYVYDWSAWLALVSDTIVSAVITPSPSDLTVTMSPITSPYSTVTIFASGGTLNQVYTVSCQMTTAANRTRTRSIRITVRNQ